MALIGTLSSGISALQAFTKGLDVIGNNIANVNTTGFKSSSAMYADSFSDVLLQSSPSPATGSNTEPMQVGTGVMLSGVKTSFAQGELSTTGKSTDMAISGNGFFIVTDPANGATFATRSGDFRMDTAGNLVTQMGNRVQGLTGGKISYVATAVNGALVYTPTATAPTTVGDINTVLTLAVGSGLTNSTGGAFTDAQVAAGAPTIASQSTDSSGSITALMSDGSSFTQGQILLQNFEDPAALTSKGNNLYSGFGSAGPIGGTTLSAANNTAGTGSLGSVQAGSLELSNVDLTQQFSDLITTQRSFEAGSRLITVSDSVLEDVVNLKQR